MSEKTRLAQTKNPADQKKYWMNRIQTKMSRALDTFMIDSQEAFQFARHIGVSNAAIGKCQDKVVEAFGEFAEEVTKLPIVEEKKV